jgi:hypothetical protein
MSCHPHPTFVEALARDRARELRHGAPARRRRRLVRAARSRTGWLLVSVGLRLAAGR